MHVAVTTSTLEGRPGGRLIFTSVHDAADCVCQGVGLTQHTPSLVEAQLIQNYIYIYINIYVYVYICTNYVSTRMELYISFRQIFSVLHTLLAHLYTYSGYYETISLFLSLLPLFYLYLCFLNPILLQSASKPGRPRDLLRSFQPTAF